MRVVKPLKVLLIFDKECEFALTQLLSECCCSMACFYCCVFLPISHSPSSSSCILSVQQCHQVLFLRFPFMMRNHKKAKLPTLTGTIFSSRSVKIVKLLLCRLRCKQSWSSKFCPKYLIVKCVDKSWNLKNT